MIKCSHLNGFSSIKDALVNGMIIILMSVFVMPFAALAQDAISVSGKVYDSETNIPLVGATVKVKGTSVGTIVKADGTYTIDVPSGNNILEVTYIGYEKREILINGRENINIMLNSTGTTLDELVVVGYTQQKKKDLTGAVAIVEASEVQSIPAASVDQMLQGKMSGVNIVNDNAPGGQAAVRIRGFSTIRNNDPLYVIDGTPSTGGLENINPNDIESIQVLKDASSASIYGSRAANGVVIITTKKGKSLKPQIDFNAYWGQQSATNLPEMLSAQEYGDLLWQAIRNDGGTPSHDVYGSGASPVIPQYIDDNNEVPSADVDWVDEIFEPAFVQNYHFGFRQGGEKSSTAFSLSYFNQEGVMRYTNFERVTGRLNTEFDLLGDRLKVGENLSVSYTTDRYVTNNSALGGLLYAAYKFPSIVPVYDNTGDFGGNTLNDIQNPLGALYRGKDNKPQTIGVFGNVFAELAIWKGISFRSDIGLNYATTSARNYNPAFDDILSIRAQSELNQSNSWGREWSWANTLRYAETLNDKHDINLFAGMEAVKSVNEVFSASRTGFPYDEENFRYLDAGSGEQQRNSGFGWEWSLLSYFGKVNYSFDNKYLASFTIRRDGSSRLGNNKWGNFPAFSLGWRLSEEDFFSMDFFSDLKIRVGWGQNGNQDIPSYSSISSYVSNPYHSNYDISGSQNSVAIGYTPTRYGNEDLKWETTTQTNIGVDFTFWDNQFEFSADYFMKKTEDLLVERPLPPVVGGTNGTVWDNVGSMENSGLEFLLNYRSPYLGDFHFDAGLNFSMITNELTELHEDIEYIALPGSVLHSVNFDQEVSRSGVGQPIASFYGHRADGIFQSQAEIDAYGLQPDARPGDIKYADINGDGVIDADDREFIGSPHPDFTFGFNFSAQYKDFDVKFFVFGSLGNEIYDLTQYYGGFFNLSAYNKFATLKDAWSESNTGSEIPRLSLDDPNNNVRPSSYYVKDGSFVRLKNFEIGYTLPEIIASKVNVRKMRVYLQVQNLLTITGYDGIDPEVGLQNYSSEIRNLDIGVDRGIYPLPRTFMFGVNINY